MDDYVTNIRAAMNAATKSDIKAGELWYARMLRITTAYGARLGLTPHQVGGVFAAYSINTPWGANLRMVSRLLHIRAPFRGTLTDSIVKAERIMSGEDIDTVLAPPKVLKHSIRPNDAYKTRMFARACSGDEDAVVVDRWALSVAQGWAECPNKSPRPCGKSGRHSCQRVPTGDEYLAVAEAYRKVARRRKHSPIQVQAIVWVQARRLSGGK